MRGRVGVKPGRGRLDDLAQALAQDGGSRAVAPVDRHGIRAGRVRVGELAVQRDRVSLVGGFLQQGQVGRGELRPDFVDRDARRRVAHLAILVGRRGDNRIILRLNPGRVLQVGMGCREGVNTLGQDDRGRSRAVAPIERNRVGPDRAGPSIVPLTLSVPPSAMLDDDNTSPGDAKTGAGLLMASVASAKAVLPKGSVRVTPIV